MVGCHGPQNGAGGLTLWPAKVGAGRSALVTHQDRNWWAGVWRTRLGTGGQCVDAPGQGLVVSVDLVPGLYWN